MSERSLIRKAVSDLVAAFVTTSVPYQNFSFEVDDLPAAKVWIEAGDIDPDFDQEEYMASSILMIELIVYGRGDLDTQLDQIASQINSQFGLDESLNGLIENVRRTGFAYDPDPESLVNSLALSYAITYEDED